MQQKIRQFVRAIFALPFSMPGIHFTALCAIAGLSSVGCENAPAPRPDIVLISVDTLRADHMGIYGYQRNTTPRIDQYFRRGMTFTAASSTAPCTFPAVRQLLYGAFDVKSDRQPLAETLLAHGYLTAAVLSQDMFHHRAKEYSRGFAHYDLQGKGEVDQHGMTSRTADEVSGRAIDWIERRPPGAPPFFLWLHYFDPHDPYQPPPAHREFDRGNSSKWSGDIRSHLRTARLRRETSTKRAERLFDANDVNHFVNLYDGEIQYTDAQIGRVLDTLDAVGRPTTVILTSDHAEFLGEDHQWGHCNNLAEPVIRVPFLLRDANDKEGDGRRIDLPVSTIDVFPTIVGRVGAEAPPSPYAGVDVRKLEGGRSTLAFWQTLAMVRRGHFKQIFVDGEPIALFNLERDPLAQRNIIAAKSALVDELAAVLAATGSLSSRIDSDSRKSIERLRQIGYIE